MFHRILQRPFLWIAIWTFVLHSTLFLTIFSEAFVYKHATDGGQYIAIANNVLAGRGFSLRLEPPYVPDTIRTPGYPAFLALWIRVAHSPHASLPWTALLGCFIPLAGMFVAKQLTDDRRIWLLTGLFLSVDINLWYYSFILGSEGLFLPLCALGIASAAWALSSRSWRVALAAGCMTGLAVLVRPIIQFVPVLFAAVSIFFSLQDRKVLRTSLKIVAAFVLGYALVVTPWLYRNARLFGAWDYANVGWFNMYTRVAATAESIATGRSYNEMRIEYLQRLHEKGYIEKSPVDEQDVHGFEYTSIFKKESWEAINQFPKEALISQVSAGWTVVSQDITVNVLRRLQWISTPRLTFSPMVVLMSEGPLVLVEKMLTVLPTAWTYAIVARIALWCIFLLAFLAPWITWRSARRSRPIVLFAWFYMMGIIALSLNAAAQADARYRSQFLFVEIPLALLSLQALMSNRRKRVENAANCPACGTHSWCASFCVRNGFPFFRCRLCGTLFADPMPSEAARSVVYGSEYFFGGQSDAGYANYESDKRATRTTYERMLDLLQPYRGTQARMLDVGSATGIFLSWARERGWRVVGQEISNVAAVRAKEAGIETTTASLASIEGVYDAVTLLDVIEHTDNPRQMIRDAMSKLETGGAILLNTPDAGSVFARLLGPRWHAICPPEHVALFPAKGLRMLLEQEGCVIRWEGRIAKRFRCSNVFGTASRWLHWKALRRVERWFLVHPRWDISILLPLRDNVAMIAQKRTS